MWKELRIDDTFTLEVGISLVIWLRLARRFWFFRFIGFAGLDGTVRFLVVVGWRVRFPGFGGTLWFCVFFGFQMSVQFFLLCFFDFGVEGDILAAKSYAGIPAGLTSKPHVE